MDTPNVITLDTPIKRESGEIRVITLRKPNGAALRGLSLQAVITMDYSALQTLVPRIADPSITPAEFGALEPADLLNVGVGVASFFVPKNLREEIPETLQ